jgi:hypothetical protein
MTRRLAAFLMVGAALVPGCGGPPSAGDTSAAFTPVATVDQVMDAIIIPSSQAVFDSVVYINGELTQSPKTDDEWFRLRMHAIAVAEAGNLLLMPPRAKGDDDWAPLSKALTAAAMRVEQAADAKNVNLMLQTGSELYVACTNCHEKYLMEQP